MSTMRPFNAEGRALALDGVEQGAYDLVVVGGGITGTGVARDAAMRGLRVALFERGDFGSSTSSASSKLLHGGIRYLEQMEFHLVWEALSERARLCQLAPHLSRPIPFLFPLYKTDPVSPFLLDMGLWLYDVMAGVKNLGLHRRLNVKDVHAMEPALLTDGLRGGCSYFDAVTDDARLTLENARSAWEHGADCLSYVEVGELVEANGEVRGVRVRDVAHGSREGDMVVRARCVVNATGPWSDVFRARSGLLAHLVRPTKGVHIMVKREKFPRNHAVVMSSPRDHRILFVIPWGTMCIVGTTDTDYDPTQGPPVATTDDVKYILDIMRHYFPESAVGDDDVLSAYAGLRPLYHEEKAGAPSTVSREHKIIEERPSLVTVVGGKLTTYRLMSASIVDLVGKILARNGGSAIGPCRTGDEMLVTRLDDGAEPASTLSPETFSHLCDVYGPRAVGVGAVARKGGAAYTAPMTGHSRDLVAQAVYGFESEMALHLDDALSRRTHALYAGISADESRHLADIVAAHLKWDDTRKATELDRFLASRAAARPALPV